MDTPALQCFVWAQINREILVKYNEKQSTLPVLFIQIATNISRMVNNICSYVVRVLFYNELCVITDCKVL